MADVILSHAARTDLVDIVEYGILHYGMEAADAYQEAIDQAFARLARYPRSGEARPIYGSGMRCLVCRKHRILYRVEEQTVQIIRVLHHTRDARRHLPDDR